jgi:SAM-dependent methyltransferase
MPSLYTALRRANLTPARMAYNPLLRAAVNTFDILPRALYGRHFSSLPPAHLRLRVGVGREVFNNHVTHLHGPRQYWLYAFSHGYVSMRSDILDLGCGCGRYALYLRDYGMFDDRYTGHYIGIDIERSPIEWCRANFDERFTFHQVRSTPRPLPVAENSIDLVFSTSLYTHLLTQDIVNYTKESYRVLRPRGWVNATFFSWERPPTANGHLFPHRIGEAFVENLARPDNAVAYHEKFMAEVFLEAGFTDVSIAPGGQMLICARKP